MLHPALTIAPSAMFWDSAAGALLNAMPALVPGVSASDLSGLRVVVPAFAHGRQLCAALGRVLDRAFIAPRICTLHGWLALQPPDIAHPTPLTSGNERLMALYAELRQHVWLKKLFTERRDTDLLPLSQTLLALADELTAALLPTMQAYPDDANARWEAALGQLPPASRSVLSDEAQLVWSVWQSQLDGDDPMVSMLSRMLALADKAQTPLVWVTPVALEPCTEAFLQAWGRRQPVLPITLDWQRAGLALPLVTAWPEVVSAPDPSHTRTAPARLPDAASLATLSLSPAGSFEEEAERGAQTVVDWLCQGKNTIAIVAQDRIVARRIRALLLRAQVQVADETGWKLSTSRAGAALAAWFDVVTSRAESTALLDFLKSPFLLAGSGDKADQVMAIEAALRRANVGGGWHAVVAVVPAGAGRLHLQQLAGHAAGFKGRRSIADWLALTRTTLDALGITAAYADDPAGMQLCLMLEAIGADCATLIQEFSFAEWRAYVGLQMESTAYMALREDRRVVMLPLNGTHLRSFDAVLLVGADATHLPSASSETLFFANAVRHELGLATRDARQLQQLRDFTELLASNPLVVLSWQAHRNGEPNPVSNWVARLDLSLARNAQAALPSHDVALKNMQLIATPQTMPAPAAAELMPKKLSASGYASLTACPYQFFATRMLGLSGLDELSELPEKRDYGDWLHQILYLYHVGVRDQTMPLVARPAFLQAVTQQIFELELVRSGAALGYYDRWQKAMPAYLEWANAREAQGWQFVVGEEARQQTLRWDSGEILLHGRIDRVDCNLSGEIEVLDYKTSNLTALKKRIQGSEDHQLPFYGLLSAVPPDGACYVALDPNKDRIDAIDAPDYAAWQQRLRVQIGSAMAGIASGAGLRAVGVESVCQYCDVRGMCRKGAW